MFQAHKHIIQLTKKYANIYEDKQTHNRDNNAEVSCRPLGQFVAGAYRHCCTRGNTLPDDSTTLPSAMSNALLAVRSRWLDGWLAGWLAGWLDGWMDGWT